MLGRNLRNLSSVTITLLCENTARGAGVLGEHGLSWWIEAEGKNVLFDLGQGLALIGNARHLGVDLGSVDAIAISHGHYDHYDHVGAWEQLPPEAKSVPVFLHPDALLTKYHKRKNGAIDIASDERFLSGLALEASQVVKSREPIEVVEGLWLSGEIPRVTDYEDSGGAFFSDKAGNTVDPLLDDQSMFFKTNLGLVVVLGCAHAGVINILRYLREITGERIHAVLGGMHLLNANSNRVERTLLDLQDIGPDWIGANHCTGTYAQARLINAFEKRFLECNAGQRLCLPNLSYMPSND